jgi:hypothetical protein
VVCHAAHGYVAVEDTRFKVLPADVADVLERARAISEKYMPEGSSASPHIRTWYRNFLSGNFDSAEMFEDTTEITTVTDNNAVGADMDISDAVEERIREIEEKGSYGLKKMDIGINFYDC